MLLTTSHIVPNVNGVKQKLVKSFRIIIIKTKKKKINKRGTLHSHVPITITFM